MYHVFPQLFPFGQIPCITSQKYHGNAFCHFLFMSILPEEEGGHGK